MENYLSQEYEVKRRIHYVSGEIVIHSGEDKVEDRVLYSQRPNLKRIGIPHIVK
jgi:hypothetical protein